MAVGNTKKDTLIPIISQFVEEGATVFTDELNAYNTLGSIGYNHKVCDHGQLQFVVDGEVYTNNIEGFWSHFRRILLVLLLLANPSMGLCIPRYVLYEKLILPMHLYILEQWHHFDIHIDIP